MKVERFILKNERLPKVTAGKACGVPKKGDVIMIFTPSESNKFYKVCSITHVGGDTRIGLERITTLAMEIRKTNGFRMFNYKIVGEEEYPIIKFFELDNDAW